MTVVRCVSHGDLFVLLAKASTLGHPVSLSAFTDPHIAAVLVKKFFRDLPEPIFHSDMYPIIRRCPMSANSTADSTTIDYIRSSILPALRSEAAEILLSYVFRTFVVCWVTQYLTYLIP